MQHFGMPRETLSASRKAWRERRRAKWAWFARRKWRRPFAGLRFFQPTNVPGSIVLASRHWPDSITWSWSVWWRSKFWSKKALWPVFAYTTNSGGNVVFGPLELHWQDEMPHEHITRDAEQRFLAEARNGPSQAKLTENE